MIFNFTSHFYIFLSKSVIDKQEKNVVTKDIPLQDQKSELLY